MTRPTVGRHPSLRLTTVDCWCTFSCNCTRDKSFVNHLAGASVGAVSGCHWTTADNTEKPRNHVFPSLLSSIGHVLHNSDSFNVQNFEESSLVAARNTVKPHRRRADPSCLARLYVTVTEYAVVTRSLWPQPQISALCPPAASPFLTLTAPPSLSYVATILNVNEGCVGFTMLGRRGNLKKLYWIKQAAIGAE